VSRSRAIVAAAALAMCAIAVLLLRPRGSAAPSWSVSLYLRVNTVTASLPGWLATVCAAFAPVGLVVLGGLAGTAAWRCWRDRSQAGERVAAVVAGLVVALILAEVIKAAIREPRPCRELAGVVSRVGCPASGHWSFPSSHAIAAAALAVAVLLLSGRVWWLAAGLAILVGVDRVVVGEHYPHDVLAGFLLGAGATIAVAEALRPWSRRLCPMRIRRSDAGVSKKSHPTVLTRVEPRPDGRPTSEHAD